MVQAFFVSGMFPWAFGMWLHDLTFVLGHMFLAVVAAIFLARLVHAGIVDVRDLRSQRRKSEQRGGGTER